MHPDFQSDNAVDRLHIMLQYSLPSYMVPAKIKMLEKMPINSSGKIDRTALADMTADSVERPCRGIVPPRNDIENAICEQFANILSEEVGITNNFFHLGGHSLMAIRLVSRINRLLQVVLSVSDIFEYLVVADLAERVCLLRGAAPTPDVPIPRAKANGPVEQSFAQGRLWFLDRLYPGSSRYLMPFSTPFRGPLQVEALVLALLALEQRHEPLRTTFEHRDGLDLQHVHPYSSEMSHVRVVHIPNGDQEVFTKVLQLEQFKPFDLEKESGWRTTIYALGAEDHVLSITMHHIISDGWSVDILQRELALFYKAASQGLEPLSQVGLLPIQYQDFSVWQRYDPPQVAEQARQLEYWKQQLDGSQSAEMFCDKARPPVPSGNAEEHQFAIDGPLYQALNTFCKIHHRTPFVVLLAAFRAAHYRLTGVEDATIGTPIANRTRQELEDLIGFFVNSQCIRIKVPKNETCGTLVQQVHLTTLEAQAHQDVPFETLVADIDRGARDLSPNPLVQMAFVVNSQQNIGQFQLDGLVANAQSIGDKQLSSRFDLELHFFEKEHSISGSIIYANNLFEAPSMQCFANIILEILARGLKDASTPIAIMPLLDEPLTPDMVALTQIHRTNYPRDASVIQLFREQATMNPQSVAIKESQAGNT